MFHRSVAVTATILLLCFIGTLGAGEYNVRVCYLANDSHPFSLEVGLHSEYALQTYSHPESNITWTFSYLFPRDISVGASVDIVNHWKPRCQVFLGPLYSSVSESIAPLIDTVWVSYGASAVVLSDKSQFPYFSRTVASDATAGYDLAITAHYFGWSLVNMVCSYDPYGQSIASRFASAAEDMDMNVDIFRCFESTATVADIISVLASEFLPSRSQILILAISETIGEAFFEALRHLGMTSSHVLLTGDRLCQRVDYLDPGVLCISYPFPPSGFSEFFGGYTAAYPALASSLVNRYSNLTLNPDSSTNPAAWFAHDAMKLIVVAMEELAASGALNLSDTMPTIRAIRTSTVEGITGIVSMNSVGDRTNATLAVYNYQLNQAEVMVGVINETDKYVATGRVYWKNLGFVSTPVDVPAPASPVSNSVKWVIVGVVVGVAGLAILALVIFIVLRRLGTNQNAAEDVPKASIPATRVNILLAGPHFGNEDDDYHSLLAIQGRYTRGRVLGTGSYATVCIATLEDGFEVAVKAIPLSEETYDTQMKAIQLKASYLFKLSHPNVVKFYGIRERADSLCVDLFMELLPGGNLSSLVKSLSAPLPEALGSKYMRQILLALEYIHSNHVVHRDLKGDNILLDAEGNVKLADFGAAIHLEHDVHVLSPIRGTPYYLAPELITSQKNGVGSDIWSLGVLCVELMSRGVLPWPAAESVWTVLDNIRFSEVVLPAHLSPNCADFVRKCLVRDPAMRPTATQLLNHPFVAPGLHRQKQLEPGN